ncbi:unnamed protein product [Amaranthus hypochondriacus]
MSINDSINYQKTQRIVLLIDLYPLIKSPNSSAYRNSLLISAKKLLSFLPIANSLSSFKLFFSSLSPLLSTSLLPSFLRSLYNPNSLSFNSANETLNLLSHTLDLVHNSVNSPGLGSRVSYVSSSMAQVIHDYSWDLCDDSDILGPVKSNMVVLFSPICRSFNDMRDFMGFDDDLINEHVFSESFKRFFGQIKDAFVSRDIHVSWVDVRCDNELGNDNKKLNVDEFAKLVGWFQNGVKSLGWGFCSSDSVVLGSALVPFGLIYPMIGVSSSYNSGTNDNCKKLCGQLNLEILDVRGNSLECRYCDLQLLNVRTLHGHRLSSLSLSEKYGKPGGDVHQGCCGIWESFGDGVVKIDVKTLCRYDELRNIELSDAVLVDELPIDLNKKKEESSAEFFADKVLDLLLEDSGRFIKRKSPPLWQVFLSFLYRKDSWALLNLSKANGSIITMGVLKPISIHSAYIFVLKNKVDCQIGMLVGKTEQNLGHGNLDTGDKTVGFHTSKDTSSEMCKNESRRKHRKHRFRYKNLSWSSFCKAAFELNEMELEEAYVSMGCDISKKLKFFRCWMKQVVENKSSLPLKSDTLEVLEKMDERLYQLHPESQQPLPQLAGEHSVKEAPQIEEAGATSQEAVETFFSDLPQRIQHGLASGVDLVAFAQRVVHSCIYWLRKSLGTDIREESQVSIEKSDGSSYARSVAGELAKILLIDPKDIAGKHKVGDQTSKAPEGQVLQIPSADRVREYELQILFRMEILQSEIVTGLKDSIKLKFVKQICRLLEFIQCNKEDGFFGDFNLNDYVSRTIKSRYSQKLGDVVHRICDQMDLLLFDNDDESPNLLLNSEDSSQSWRIGDNDRGSEPNSTDDSFNTGSNNHDRKLVEAQERRARASRLASFTRRAMPELQRVWAPKPSKLSRSKSDSSRRSKRKHRHKERYDMVCETPISAPKKCLFPADTSVGGSEFRALGGSSDGPIHRALFQDDETWHDDLGL